MDIEQQVQHYKQTHCSKEFDHIWNQTVGMVNPNKYFDPTNARTIEDFNQVTRIALLEAIKTYDPSAGSTVLSWIKMKMSQFLIKELKKINREMRIHGEAFELDREDESGSNQRETIHLKLFDGIEVEERVINAVIQEVRARLSTQILILQTFDLKLVFPEISRQSMHEIIGVSKPTLSKYFKVIRAQCLDCFKKHRY